jgi:hypothetical protein
MRAHATSCIGETGLKIFNSFMIFFNGFSIFLNGFPKSSTAFCFPRNPRKSIYGEKYMKDHYLSFVFFCHSLSHLCSELCNTRYNTQHITCSRQHDILIPTYIGMPSLY